MTVLGLISFWRLGYPESMAEFSGNAAQC